VRTILEAEATPEELAPTIEDLAAEGKYSYEVQSDKAAIAGAEKTIRSKGFAAALSDWTKAVSRGEVSKANTALGWALYNNAANNGDTDTALSILDNMVAHQRSAAQAVQATRILKALSPETQLYGVQKSVARLQEELNERYRKGNAPELEIDRALAEQFLRARSDKERDRILRDIYRDIGRQMPSRFRDRWNAWRYLSMLGNPRTSKQCSYRSSVSRFTLPISAPPCFCWDHHISISRKRRMYENEKGPEPHRIESA